MVDASAIGKISRKKFETILSYGVKRRSLLFSGIAFDESWSPPRSACRFHAEKSLLQVAAKTKWKISHKALA
jgi:hypothetical protein